MVMNREPLSDRERAQAGPRQLKEAGSPEWCWQTVSYLKDYMRHVDEEWRQAGQVLDELLRARAWRVIPPGKPYGSMDAMLKAEVGLGEKAIKDAIRKATLVAHGGDRRSAEFQGNNITLKLSRGTSETYIVRRLRRDRPDLAERVERGEMSANKAAVEAGFRDKHLSVPIGQPQRLAETLRKHMTPDQIRVLLKLLADD
jgi:hypothetical protein